MLQRNALVALAAAFGVSPHTFNTRGMSLRSARRLYGEYKPVYGKAREPAPKHIQSALVIAAAAKRARRCAKRDFKGSLMTTEYWQSVRL